MEVDVVGGGAGAIMGAAVAHAVDPAKGHEGELHHACADCGTPVSGKFCTECGQPAHVHRSLLHLGHELLHGVMHFDGRIWRTLPLLFLNPGRLTREWNMGKRSRYVSPLALFLFTLFVIFFGLSFMPQPQINPGMMAQAQMSAEDLAQMEKTLAKSKAHLSKLEAEFETSRGGERIAIGTTIGTLSGHIPTLEAKIAAQKAAQVSGDLNRAIGPRADGLEPGSWQAQLADAELKADGKGIAYKLLKKLKNPDLLVYKLQQTAYKYAFLLVPLSIPFVWLLFLWRRGFTLYDHGVFVLYSLTFIAILTLLAGLLIQLIPPMATTLFILVCLIVPVHMFAQVKGAYGLGVFSALWRTFMLQIFCSIVLGLFLMAILYLGVGF